MKQARVLKYAKCTRCYDRGYVIENRHDWMGKFDINLFSCKCRRTKVRAIKHATKILNIHENYCHRTKRKFWMLTNRETALIIKKINHSSAIITPLDARPVNDFEDDDLPF